MNKLLRNTVLLGSLWAVIFIVGMLYIYGYQRKISKNYKIEEIEKSKRLNEFRVLKVNYSELQNYYKRLQTINLRYKGTLTSFESPGETFDYIRRELTSTSSTVKLNMDFIKEDTLQSMIKRQYELQGTGNFVDIYYLLWFLENGPVFYKIESLKVNKIEKTNIEETNISLDEASFNLTMVGFDRKQGPKITEINREFGQPKNMANLFNHKSLFKKKKPKLEQKTFALNNPPKSGVMHLPRNSNKSSNGQGLPEINSSCKVLAITPFSILLKDINGKLVKLRKGDQVFGGNLSELNTQTGQAVFSFYGDLGNKSVILTLKK